MLAAGTVRSYRAKVRFLAAALRRPENAELRRRALDGHIMGRDLVSRTEESFLPDNRLAERRRHLDEALHAVCLRGQPLDLFDAGIVCPQCGAAGANYAVLSDSFLVESSSTYTHRKPRDATRRLLIECVACGERRQQEEAFHL